MRIKYLAIVAALVVMTLPARSEAARLKDLATIEGVRTHSLIGYGLVVGLQQTGDDRRAPFAAQSISSLLKRMGVVVPPDALHLRNVAAVIVTAKLPAFSRVGQKIDVTVASMGNAKSLAGGMFVLTPLKGPDGQIYGSAQGLVTVGGFEFSGPNTQVRRNHTAVGTIPAGGNIERGLESQLAEGKLRLILTRPDFTTSQRVADAIDNAIGTAVAVPKDATSIEVSVPESYKDKVVALIASLESIDVEPDGPSRVVINERTGTVVLGRDVRIGPVAVAHGNLTVEISTQIGVSQPAPFSQNGVTVVAPETNVKIDEERGQVKLLSEGGSLEDVVTALNELGATPRDLIAILQAIKAAGALDADLEVR